jgi:hypothetical protein
MAATKASSGVYDAYRARPDYQRNDYLGWISRAKREVTQLKRSNRCWTSSSAAAWT